jgi:hypothetical protein
MRTTLTMLLLAGALGAGELTPEERSWLEQWTDALDAESNRVREAASRAIVRLGLDAVPALVERTPRFKTDRGWKQLERSLRGMGAADAAKALKAVQADWPAKTRMRLDKLVADLTAGPGPADPAVLDKVRKALAEFEGVNSYSSNNKTVKRIVAMGRPAVPALIQVLREPRQGFGFVETAATDALKELVEPRDRAALTELLILGVDGAAKCFAKIPGEESLAALLTAVDKRMVGHELVQALGRYKKEERTHRALREYLRRHGKAALWEASEIAVLLAEGRAFAAREQIEELAGLGAGEDHAIENFGKALAMLGSRNGLKILIELFAAPRTEVWVRHRAGTELNSLIVKRIYVGRYTAREPTGNFEEAAQQFRDWYAENRLTMKFDKSIQRWMTPDKVK